MVTGFEIAGIFLGALPFVLKAIDFYVANTEALIHHNRVLIEFRRELGMQRCIFRDICFNLFRDEATPEELAALMESPASAQLELGTRLRSHAVPHFIKAVKALNEVFNELKVKFEFEVEMSSKKLIRRLKRNFTFIALKSYCDEQLAFISKTNTNLQCLVNGGLQMQATGHSGKSHPTMKATKAIRFHNRVRSHAINLYALWKEKLQKPHCACEVAHTVSLQLERRNETTATGIATERNQPSTGHRLNFTFLFALDSSEIVQNTIPPWRYQELVFEHMGEVENLQPLPLNCNQDGLATKVETTTSSVNDLKSELPNTTPPLDWNYLTRSSTSTSPSGLKQVTDGILNGITKLRPSLSRDRSPGPAKKSVGFAENIRIFSRKPADESQILPSPCPSPSHDIICMTASPLDFAIPEKKTSDISLLADNSDSLNHTLQSMPNKVPSIVINEATGRKEELLESLCWILRSHEYPKLRPTCIGVIVDEKGRKHTVWLSGSLPTRIALATEKEATVSLAQLLSSCKVAPTQRDRFTLAVKLAQSVVQLHSTEWLGDGWGKQDVFFLKDSIFASDGRLKKSHPTLEKPMLKRSFGTSASSEHQSWNKSRVVWCNRTLFSLGIVLIEICLWKGLQDLAAAHDPNTDSSLAEWSDIRAFETSNLIWDQLEATAPQKYCQAIRACIAGLTHIHTTSWEDDAFKKEVWQMVVSPLEENLALFEQPI